MGDVEYNSVFTKFLVVGNRVNITPDAVKLQHENAIIGLQSGCISLTSPGNCDWVSSGRIKIISEQCIDLGKQNTQVNVKGLLTVSQDAKFTSIKTGFLQLGNHQLYINDSGELKARHV